MDPHRHDLRFALRVFWRNLHGPEQPQGQDLFLRVCDLAQGELFAGLIRQLPEDEGRIAFLGAFHSCSPKHGVRPGLHSILDRGMALIGIDFRPPLRLHMRVAPFTKEIPYQLFTLLVRRFANRPTWLKGQLLRERKISRVRVVVGNFDLDIRHGDGSVLRHGDVSRHKRILVVDLQVVGHPALVVSASLIEAL
jgi:hypothetical protein